MRDVRNIERGLIQLGDKSQIVNVMGGYYVSFLLPFLYVVDKKVRLGGLLFRSSCGFTEGFEY